MRILPFLATLFISCVVHGFEQNELDLLRRNNMNTTEVLLHMDHWGVKPSSEVDVPQYKGQAKSMIDWENIDSDIWKEFDYWDFYFLSLFDKHGLLSRKSHLVYYNKDPIAFMDPNASTFKSMADDLDISNLRVSVIDYSKHDIQVDFALKLISAR